MRPLVLGAGAVGLGLASALLSAGQRVQLVARGETRGALRSHGLRRTGILGEAHHGPDTFDVVGRPAEASAVDAVLVCMKTFATAEAARLLAEATDRIEKDAPIVLCQNGWGNAEQLTPPFPLERVFCASVLTGFRRPDRTTSDITVQAAPIRMGSLSGASSAPLAGVCAAIAAGGIPCETTDEMAAELWAKILYNGCLNPLGAILDVPYGSLAEGAETRARMDRIAHEIFAVMHAAGYATHWADADAWLAHFYDVLIPPTRAHESSMLQDIRAGRRTEIESLTGAVVALAREHAVDAPENERLLAAVRTAEESAVRTRAARRTAR